MFIASSTFANMLAVTSNRYGRPYLFSLGAVVVIAGICYMFSHLIGYKTVAFILLVTVSIIAITSGILPVLLSAALSAFVWNFFFIPPRFTFHVATTEDTILFFMYFIIAMINGVLTFKIRQAEKITQAKEEKARSVKLYNTILNSLSHELRTPVAAIIAASDNLQSNRYLSDDNKEQLLAEISKASLRLNQQVENLLNISRLESGHIQPKYDWCDIVELVYDIVKQAEDNNNGRNIHVSIQPDLPLCSVDKGMLEQIIYNMLNNAVMHTEPGTYIEISGNCHADLLRIVVQDNGKGFTDVPVKDIFSKFSKSRSANSTSSGLGLSIIKGFTEAMGGSLEAKNVKDAGALVEVTLPVKTININAVG